MKRGKIFFEEYIDDCNFKYQIPRKVHRKKNHEKTMYCPKCEKVKVFTKYEPAGSEIAKTVLQDTQRELQVTEEAI